MPSHELILADAAQDGVHNRPLGRCDGPSPLSFRIGERNGSSAVSCAVLGDPVKLDMMFDSRFCVQFPFCGVKQSMAFAR